MPVAELVSVEQYIHMSFEHDAEFVEGRIVERPMPTWLHSCMQGFLTEELRSLGRRLGFFAVPEQRVRFSPDCYRIPDVCVVLEEPVGEFITNPPYLCVEILSPSDTAAEALAKVREYLAGGVTWVWVIDPVTRCGQVHSRASGMNVEDRIFSTDRFRIDITNFK